MHAGGKGMELEGMQWGKVPAAEMVCDVVFRTGDMVGLQLEVVGRG